MPLQLSVGFLLVNLTSTFEKCQDELSDAASGLMALTVGPRKDLESRQGLTAICEMASLKAAIQKLLGSILRIGSLLPYRKTNAR